MGHKTHWAALPTISMFKFQSIKSFQKKEKTLSTSYQEGKDNKIVLSHMVGHGEKEQEALTSHLVIVSRGYILNVRLVLGSNMRIPSKPI